MATDKLAKIKRVIHFYELEFEFHKDFHADDGDQFRELFRIIIDLAKTRAKIRYQSFGEKSVFIQEVRIQPENRIILGKLRCIRTDLLPELMNTRTDEARGIEADPEEGLLETTHFIIDFSTKGKKVLAIEHNQFGSRIGDFMSYLINIGVNKKALKSARPIPIVRDDLAAITERLNKCSELVVKVHKDNIEKIKRMDGKIWSALKAAMDQFKSDYATLILKFDYKHRESTPEVNDSIFNLINGLVEDRSKTEYFDTLEVRGEDRENNYLLESFDLLIDKVRVEVLVQKQKRYRTVISADIFDKMKGALTEIRVR